MTKSEPAEADARDNLTISAAKRRLWPHWVGFVVFCGLCVALTIWTERKTLGSAIVDRKLASAHVRARYRIVDLGLGRQRLADVVIGDPARPDLTADWIELRTRIGLGGAAVTAVRAGGLQLRALIVDGRLSLGEIDRLLPRSTGAGGVRFPAIDLEVADARARVTSALGAVDVALSGGGRLDDGFRGHVAAVSNELAATGCTARRLSFAAAVRIDRGAVALAGPLGAERIACRGAIAQRPWMQVEATLARGLSAWRGAAAVRTGRVSAASLVSESAAGRISFAGSAASTAGELALASGRTLVSGVACRALAVAGRYRLAAEPRFAGRLRAASVSAPAGTLAAIRRLEHAAPATPIAPLLKGAATALARAARDVDFVAQVGIAGGAVSLARLDAVARSGARASFLPPQPMRVADGALGGTVRVSGGGLPAATIRLARAGRGDTIRGIASIAPYAAGAARLALAPVRFVSGRGGLRITTVVTLSGPLADGRVEGMRVPIAANWSGAGVLTVDPGCITIAFDRLAVATLRLGAARLPLCATGPALLRVVRGRVAGGARIPALRLAGSLGSAPLTLGADDVQVAFGRNDISARAVAANLGEPGAATQLDIARLSGAVSARGVAGVFAGAAGHIGKVPLLLSDADGDWRLEHGALTIVASATVADADPVARFRPMRAEAIRLRLAGGAIGATATLATRAPTVSVATVAITHEFARGAGSATLVIPKLAFTEGFQPDALTPLTFGVIADVRGTVTGDARMGWSLEGVTSTGTFHTDGVDLAAAFGPVTGLAGTIRFTDLLAMASAPGQVATVASINPGVPVTDGRIVYQLLPDSRVRVSSGHWPFAGGSLHLQGTTLALGGASERRLTFTPDGVDAGRFLQQFAFNNLSATGAFDGTLPMIFDASGGRIEGGRLRVRRGGGNIAYLGELTQKDLGVWGDVAFQALRSIDYRDLAIEMNGPLAGEMITEVRFAGISQGEGAQSNFLIRRLQRLPFVFNIRIRAPFRGLIDSAQSFYDPSRLISRNLPALIDQQNDARAPTPPLAIQPGASEPRP